MSRASEYANSVSSLYAQIGEARAREAANKGQIWGGALANIGDFVAQYPERKAKLEQIKNQAEETKLRREQMERQAVRETRQDQEDQAYRDLFKTAAEEWQQGQPSDPLAQIPMPSGVSSAPGTVTREAMEGFIPQSGMPQSTPTTGPKRSSPLPTPAELMRINPTRSLAILKGLEALKIDTQGDPKADADALQKVALGLNALPEDLRASAYPDLVKNYPPAKRLLDAGKLRADYDPTYWKFIMGTGQEPPKPAPVKEPELVPQPGPNGPVYGPKVAGAPVYEKPTTAADKNPTEWSLIAEAAKGDATAKRALQIYRQQHPEASGEKEPLVAVMKDGKSVYVRRSQAEGMTPATTREQGRQMTSGDANRLADINQSLMQAKELEGILGKTGAGSAIGAALPNVVTQATGIGAASKTRQAQIDRVKQIIGKGLEGGVLRKEDELKYAKILPTIGDAPEVAAGKIRGLQQTLQDKRDALLDALDDANYDTSKYRARPVPTPGSTPEPAPTKPQGAVSGRVGPYTYVVK